jgi:hypothetical protein
MSKCSRCQNDFTPLIKNNGLPYKTCDRCRYTDDKYRDKHKEQIKEYREANKEQRKEYDIYYRELNKDMLKEKAKEYREVNKDKISTKLKLDRIKKYENDEKIQGGDTQRIYNLRASIIAEGHPDSEYMPVTAADITKHDMLKIVKMTILGS